MIARTRKITDHRYVCTACSFIDGGDAAPASREFYANMPPASHSQGGPRAGPAAKPAPANGVCRRGFNFETRH